MIKRNKMLKQFIMPAFITFSLVNPLIYASVSMDVKVVDFSNSNLQEKNLTLYIDKDYIVSSEKQGFVMIYNLKENNVASIDHNKGIYRVIDESFIGYLKREQAEMKTRMQESISKASAEKRAMMEVAMRQQMSQWNTSQAVLQGSSSIRKTTRMENVKNYRCTVFENYDFGEKTREYCVVSWGDLNFNKDDLSVIQAMGKFSNDIFSKLKSMSPAQEGLHYFAYAAELDGFPVLIREFSKNTLSKESVIEHAEKRMIDSKLFAPLQDYKKLGVSIYYSKP